MLSALGAVFLCVLAIGACGSGVPGNGVARVGDYVITKADFTHWLTVAAASSAGAIPGQTAKPQVPDAPNFTNCIAQKKATAAKPAKGQPVPTDAQFKSQCQQEYTGLRDQVMQFLISADWIQGEASDQGIKITDAEVTKQFNTIKKQQFPKEADFQKFLASSGMTLKDLLFRVRLDVLSNKLRTKVTKGKDKATDKQVADYYNQNKQRFAQPERRDLRIILTKTQAQAQTAQKAVASGQAFKAVAKKYSIDQASKAQGGVLLGVARGQQEKALDDAVFAAKVGVLTGPVKTQFGYYVFRVQKITPATQQSLAQASPQIKQLLASQGSQKALETFVKGFKKKWTSKTTCRTGYIVPSCSNAPKPKASTTPPGVTPQQGGAPPQGGAAPPSQGGAPPSQGGAPPQSGGAPPSQGGAPPQSGGAPPSQGGAPQGGAPPQSGGAPPPQSAPPAGSGGSSGTP
ncbi:MAG TPA: peptidyl-prolyl cis-trans isomerase [Solirubrobacteraceae bacterium]|nr:peptidyl-prolyl cis-trans isomerase [Solirubrobacteraceae bacterium]